MIDVVRSLTDSVELIYPYIGDISLENPGALDEEPMILDLEGGKEKEEEETTTIKPYSPELALLETRTKIIYEKINDAALISKFNTGYYNGKIQGIAIGLFLSLLIYSLFFTILLSIRG